MAAATSATRRWRRGCSSAISTAATITKRSWQQRRVPAAYDDYHGAIARRAVRASSGHTEPSHPSHRPPMRRLFHVSVSPIASKARKIPFSAWRAQLSPLHTCPLYRGLLTQICATAEGARGLAWRGEEGVCDLTHFDALLSCFWLRWRDRDGSSIFSPLRG